MNKNFKGQNINNEAERAAPMRPEHEFSDDERRLYDLMSEISEDCYAAEWMGGNEFALWDAIKTGDLRYGMCDMDSELLCQVAALSVKTGRWIIWRDDGDGLDPHDTSEWGPYSVSLADWNARRAAPSSADVALPPLDAELPPPVWGVVETVGDMVRNLLTLDQSLPIHTAFHVDIEGERRCRTRSVTISRERVIEGKWVDSARKDVPYAIIVWAKQDERAYIDSRTAGTAPDELRHIESEAVSAMLWLYRRLPRCYGRPPNVEWPITALAKLAGVEMNFVTESFAERAAAPSHSPAEEDK